MCAGDVWTVSNKVNGTVTLSAQNQLLYCDSRGQLGMVVPPQGSARCELPETEFEITATNEGGMIISSAQYDAKYLRSDGRGVANIAPAPQQWEHWVLYRLDNGSPYERFLGKKLIIKSALYGGRRLNSNANGHVSAALLEERGSCWRLVETGLGSIVLSNDAYNQKNLQCNPSGGVCAFVNRLSWEHWTLAAPDTTLLRELGSEWELDAANLYCICSDEFENRRLMCTNDGTVSASSNRSASEIWEIDIIE